MGPEATEITFVWFLQWRPWHLKNTDYYAGSASERLAVVEAGIWNCEANNSQPNLRCTPAIIRFPGYNPLPAANTSGERFVRRRTSLGLFEKETAKRLGADPGALARWERGEREPGDNLKRGLESLV